MLFNLAIGDCIFCIDFNVGFYNVGLYKPEMIPLNMHDFIPKDITWNKATKVYDSVFNDLSFLLCQIQRILPFNSHCRVSVWINVCFNCQKGRTSNCYLHIYLLYIYAILYIFQIFFLIFLLLMVTLLFTLTPTCQILKYASLTPNYVYV